MYKPYSYQLKCLNVLESVRATGLTRALVVMASGLGKTVTMAFDAKAFRERQGGGRVLFLCHNNDILYQAKTTFHAVNGPERTYGYFHGEEKHLHHVDFLFASFQTMERSRELFDPTEFAYIVVDESHHSQADTYRSTVEYFRPQFLLGATATPNRLDQLDIRELFGHEVYYLPLEEAIVRGLVTPVDYRLLTDEIVLSEELKAEDGSRVSLAELNRKVFIPRRDGEIAKIIARHTAGFQNPRTMIFCNSIRHCEHLAKFIPDSFAIHSKVPDRERAVKLEMFRQGIISTVLTVNAFNEGIDIPQANMVVFLRSTTSNTIFLQQLGRGLRKSDGKDKVIALDFVANCERIKMVHTLWRQIEDAALQRRGGGDLNQATSSPMMLNVNSVNFTETIVPLLRLMDRVRPARVSEVEYLLKKYSSCNPIPADRAVAGSAMKYLWICSICSYEWQSQGSRRMQGRGCPSCANKVVTEKNNLAITHSELAKEYSIRNILPVTAVTAGTNKKLWWRCASCTYEWETRGADRVAGKGCPSCARQRVTHLNNLTITNPELVKEYSSRNLIPATQVIASTSKKLWWICQMCMHEWQAVGASRSRGVGCPSCTHRIVTTTNNLAVTYPKLSKEYSTRNALPATEVVAGSYAKYWWICGTCHHEWQVSGSHRIQGSHCPRCAVKKRISSRNATVMKE